MSEPARKPATYEDLCSIPENTVGEIVNGELIVTQRPSRKHGYVATALVEEVGPPYHRGRGGPGGWIIIMEPEIGLEENTLVPDLAGWKRERFPVEEPHNWISVSPDWGLTIHSALDQNAYEKGIKISDEEMAQLRISREEFHGEWNYSIHPRKAPA